MGILSSLGGMAGGIGGAAGGAYIGGAIGSIIPGAGTAAGAVAGAIVGYFGAKYGKKLGAKAQRELDKAFSDSSGSPPTSLVKQLLKDLTAEFKLDSLRLGTKEDVLESIDLRPAEDLGLEYVLAKEQRTGDTILIPLEWAERVTGGDAIAERIARGEARRAAKEEVDKRKQVVTTIGAIGVPVVSGLVYRVIKGRFF